MARKRYKPEEIVAFWSRRATHGGRHPPDWGERGDVLSVLKSEQVKRLKDLELENSRLREPSKCRLTQPID